MPQLNSISVRGFKSLAKVESLSLGPINIIIGANGSGKSNLISVFSFLHAIRQGKLQEYVSRAGGADALLHFGKKVTPDMSFHLSFRGDENQYSIDLQSNDFDELVPKSETVRFWRKQEYSQPYTESVPPRGKEAGIGDYNSRVAKYVRDHLDRWRVYHFHDTSSSSSMKKTADINDNRFLRPDGANLAPFLFLLKSKHPNEYQFIKRNIQLIAPFFEDFVLEPNLLNPEKIRLEWKHVGTDKFFDASALSDGTLRFIALATLFLQPFRFRPSVILVDEPELGLHPSAITILSAMVKQIASQTQIILSTQSPFLLDNFDPEHVLVAEREIQSTVFARLKMDRLEKWLEDYSLGQLWEKNELGGRPK
jgi:predicted ATPase